MSIFRPRNWLDRVFAVGIVGKGLDGVLELVGGLLLLFITPGQIQHIAAAWTHAELSEDPHDMIATHLLHTAHGLSGHAVLFGALYLLAHGVVKVVLVAALLLNKLWAYPWMIVVLLLFIAYQIYRIALDPTAGLIALTIFDALIVGLTWREYREQRHRRATEGHNDQGHNDDSHNDDSAEKSKHGAQAGLHPSGPEPVPRGVLHLNANDDTAAVGAAVEAAHG